MPLLFAVMTENVDQSSAQPEDETLCLVPLTRELAEAYAKLVARNEDHLSLPQEERGRTVADVIRKLKDDSDRNLKFAIKYDGTVVGRIDLNPVDPPTYAVGYWVAKDWTGRGIATAALALAVGHARDVLGATNIYAGVVAANRASARVLSRNGFHRVAQLESHDRYHLPLDGRAPRNPDPPVEGRAPVSDREDPVRRVGG